MKKNEGTEWLRKGRRQNRNMNFIKALDKGSLFGLLWNRIRVQNGFHMCDLKKREKDRRCRTRV